jgi:peroxiredoxin
MRNFNGHIQVCMSFSVVLLFQSLAYAQQDTLPDFLRKPFIPPFTLIGTDSSLITNESLPKKSLLMILFNPDCEYCAAETDSITANIEMFKDIEILMISFQPMDRLRQFYDNYKLQKYHNIMLGRDKNYFFFPFFDTSTIPFFALYDSRGKFIKSFNGLTPITAVIEVFNKYIPR